jgi:hypothetical protein
MSETSAIVTPSIAAINATGLAFVFRCQAGLVKVRRAWMHLSPAGSPDVIGWMLDGSCRFVGIEAKVEGKKPSPEQEATRLRILAAGGVAGVAFSVTEAVDIIRAAARKEAA